jgi:predicted secreted Zn-dependent protease
MRLFPMKRPAGTRSTLDWAKSSYSYANGNCVEVAGLSSEVIWVRNSRDPRGSVLAFTTSEWDAFVGGVRKGEFDRP